MKSEKTPVFFVPGLAAGEEIFRNIELPGEFYDIQVLEWQIPEKNETLVSYAKRMAQRITQKNAVLVGVSFGGVVAQEMSQFLELKQLIIISSVKSRYELPRRIKFARKTFFYKLIPTSLVLSAEDLTKFAIGPRTEKRLRIYQEYLHVRDKQYLDWAIKQMVCWSRKVPINEVIHIHGDKDVVFPIKNIQGAIILQGGTHIMIINKGRWLSKKLIEIIGK
ncbi:alpha/beta fold hydrolase [Constantimarinum furrinae]|uniref:Alpha/beta hydrolase n=1 Tax=Constantimarinum furrinae TaxID=2562285 RepID=A0A7G8PVZ7_9FLAO|nr:alpha/beta hydrolase [Constantimarinum furrinae]QNJ98513.1 alpha/beta hydrolase [Constantimarinum furrinae]